MFFKFEIIKHNFFVIAFTHLSSSSLVNLFKFRTIQLVNLLLLTNVDGLQTPFTGCTIFLLFCNNNDQAILQSLL
jgi:hypothetical protein